MTHELAFPRRHLQIPAERCGLYRVPEKYFCVFKGLLLFWCWSPACPRPARHCSNSSFCRRLPPVEIFRFPVPFQVPCDLRSRSPPASPNPLPRKQRPPDPTMLCLLSHLLYRCLSQDDPTSACIEPSALTVHEPLSPWTIHL